MNDEDSGRIHVLCVDDERDSADLTALRLERIDGRFAVGTATSAEAGFEYLEENDVDCVVSDYKMPDVDGITFFELVRDERPRLPFILFTGRGSSGVADDARSRGVTDYLEKDAENRYQVLADQIKSAVEKARRP
ncbi:response regulator [Halalkalicoccus sp. NIPERK01]|uniref:response regulator n=1 Tax=Halalkalicoccus sp. NIPERK01 TaxID=3053469 RepID=UPI00256F1CE8|nr:response regulator [Halalkalicoccus sp. NIPERK01]MDL5363300.1 response regulator [Halalkalicoccus sp. NIPERK01]